MTTAANAPPWPGGDDEHWRHAAIPAVLFLREDDYGKASQKRKQVPQSTMYTFIHIAVDADNGAALRFIYYGMMTTTN